MHASLVSLVVVIIAAFLTPIVLNRLRLKSVPVVVAEMIAGLIIGKSGFNWVEHGPWIEILSSLGLIFLMFLSGVEIDFSMFLNSRKKRSGREPNGLAAAGLVFLAIFVVSFLLALFFKWAGFAENAFFMTLVISTISLGVVMPTLKENHLMKTGIGQILLLITVIADLVTMILLAVFVSLYDPNGGDIWLLFVLFAAGFVLYFVGKVFKHMTFLETMSKGTFQIGTRAVFALIIVLVGLSETVGAENILGAFIAGVLVSLLSPNKEMVQKLDSFGYGFLIPIFFVMVGVDLNIWELFKDPKVVWLIPLLFVALLISKMVPVLILKKWYDFRTVVGSGLLLTSTLSLVVAAAKVGERIRVIDDRMASALILLAIVTCLITPVLFRKVFPKTREEKKRIVLIGANQLTLPLSVELDGSRYQTVLYHTVMEKLEADDTAGFEVTELPNYDAETLERAAAFDADILVTATGSDETNVAIAKAAAQYGVPRVIARVENPALFETLKNEGIAVFSSLFSTKAILKAMILLPGMIDLLTTAENGLYQIAIENPAFHGMALRRFPFLGDTIIIRLYRDGEAIVPNGDTVLQLGDQLIVTGGKAHVDRLAETLAGAR